MIKGFTRLPYRLEDLSARDAQPRIQPSLGGGQALPPRRVPFALRLSLHELIVVAVIHLHKPGRFVLLGIVLIVANSAAVAGDIALDTVRNNKVAVVLLDPEVQQALVPEEVLAKNREMKKRIRIFGKSGEMRVGAPG